MRIETYPFLKANTIRLEGLDLKIEDLVAPEMSPVFDRAKQRVRESILHVSVGLEREKDVELLSYPMAIIITIATNNSFIKRRYALAESKHAYNNMKKETNEDLIVIAKDFGVSLEINKDERVDMEFAIKFTDYLKYTKRLKDSKWRLINSRLLNGIVYLNHHDVARLLQEVVYERIENKLEMTELPPFPEKILTVADQLIVLAREKIGVHEMEGFPMVVTPKAFPPCIEHLYKSAQEGSHLSHIARFTLSSFLIHIGMTIDKVCEVFKNFSDYNERLTRYHVEHIAGQRGSKTQYTPPRCDTLQTHGVCPNGDNMMCRRVNHPLLYYKRKQKQI